MSPVRRVAARLAALAAVTFAGPAAAQPLPFGSGDDLFETARTGADGVAVGVFGGAAYLPDTWRGAIRGEASAVRGPLSASVAATLHPSVGGFYGPEADEAVDVLRAVEYVRLDRAPGQPVYARLGPTQNVTLGAGALARRYRTTTAWDERTLGIEAAVTVGRVSVAGFADDVRLGGVVGGELEVRTALGAGPLGGLRLAVGAVHDLGLRGDSALTGVEATLRGDLAGGRFAADAPFGLTPFVTVAGYDGRGRTLGVGADLAAFRFSETLTAGARVAVFASSARFVPGHVGPFYAVSNADERIVTGASGGALAGTSLDSLRAGVDVVVDLRFVVFGRVEVSQHVRRHVGADRASAYGLRLAARLPGRARAELALDRLGFRGVWGLFGGAGETALVLDVAAPAGRGLQAFVRSRYGYRRLDAATFGEGRFLAERRFEPLVGLRVGLR